MLVLFFLVLSLVFAVACWKDNNLIWSSVLFLLSFVLAYVIVNAIIEVGFWTALFGGPSCISGGYYEVNTYCE